MTNPKTALDVMNTYPKVCFRAAGTSDGQEFEGSGIVVLAHSTRDGFTLDEAFDVDNAVMTARTLLSERHDRVFALQVPKDQQETVLQLLNRRTENK